MERTGTSDPLRPADGRAEQASAQRESSGPPHHFHFSTREIPPEGKFEAWRDLWFRLAEVDVSTRSPKSFEGSVDVWNAGLLSVAGTEAQGSCYGRSTRLANNASDEVSLTLCRVDGTYSVAGADPSGVKRDGAFIVPHDRTFAITAPEHCRSDVLLIDRSALLNLLPRSFDLASQSFEPSIRLLDLIRGMVPLITCRTEPTTAERRAALGQQIIDLVALLLTPSRDGRALIESRGLKASRMGAVLQAIDRRFADPDFSVDTIGLELGISGRQVHRLLEETTKTFYEHLLERRLQHAYELLSNPMFDEAKIVKIAAQAGFANVTHFKRLFRMRFGDTPSGVRASAVTRHSLRPLRQSLGDTL